MNQGGKESLSVGTQTAERPLEKQNSFSDFVSANSILFDQHRTLTAELRDEDRGWKNSAALKQFIEEHVELSISKGPQGRIPFKTGKQLDQVKKGLQRSLLAVVFMGPKDTDIQIKKIQHAGFAAAPRANNVRTEESVDFINRLKEFSREYHEATDSLRTKVRESRIELLRKAEGYLSSDSSNLFIFQDFLTNKKYASIREKIRPFLADFAQEEDHSIKDKKDGIIVETAKTWREKLIREPTQEILDEFSLSIKDPTVLSWLKVIAKIPFYQERVNANGSDTLSGLDPNTIAEILKDLRYPAIWPKELKGAFMSFIYRKYSLIAEHIQRELLVFNKPVVSQGAPNMDAVRMLSKRQKPKGGVSAEEKAEDRLIAEKTAEKKHPVGVIVQSSNAENSLRLLTDDEINKLCEKESPLDDPRAIADLRNTIDSLRKEPFGPGTKPLTNKDISIDGRRRITLRRLDPRTRIKTFSNPDSRKIRVVFALVRDENAGEDILPSIAIEGIYTHDAFDKKFT